MSATLQPLITTGLASQSGHWYTPEGAPAYEIEGRNGVLRAVTLRDARKLNLYPSVTTILACSAKPQLERWKIEQAMLATLTLPRVEWESDTDFMARALDDSKEQARRAAERGTLIHAQIERSFTNQLIEPAYRDFVYPVRAWLDTEFGSGAQWRAERSFSCRHGYGGKVDLHAREPQVVIDFKTKDFDDLDKIKGYDEQGMQLAAYAVGLGLGNEQTTRINLFVSTRVPGLIVPIWHEPNTFARHWAMFGALLQYWQMDKGYAPL